MEIRGISVIAHPQYGQDDYMIIAIGNDREFCTPGLDETVEIFLRFCQRMIMEGQHAAH